MPSNFGTTPLSTTALGTNQFPVSAGFVPNTASGNLTSIQLGPSSTDSNGYTSAPVAMYLPDGNDVTLGTSTDANTVNSVMGRLTKIRDLLNATLTVTVSSGTVAATQSGTWNINNITGSISLPTGAAQDATVAKLNIAPSTALGSNTGPMVQGNVAASAPTYTTGNINPLSLTTAGALRVDGSNTVQPVSGTFWQTTQPVSGTLTVTQATGSNLHAVIDSGSITATTNADTTIGGTTAPSKGILAIGKTNDGTAQYQPLPEGAGGRSVIVEGFTGGTAVPVSGTFWQATQPISGTVTVQQTTGSNLHVVLDAGSAVIGHVVTDSGSTTAVTQATASNLNAQVVGSVASGSSNTGNPVKTSAVYNSTQPTVTNGQIVDNQATARGALIVATGIDAFAVNASQSGTWTVQQGGSNWTVSVAQINGTTTDTNTGNASAGTQRVVLASNQPAIPASQSGSWSVNAGTGTFTNQQTNITADYDTSAGTQNLTMFGVALPASGGAVAGGTSSNPLRTDPTGTTTQPISVASLPALPAHQSTNVDQWNGTTVDTNSGNKSAGTIRVVLATDQPSLTNALSVSQSGSWAIQANAGTNLNTSALALDTSVNGILVAQASTTSGQKGPLIQGAVTTNAPSYTTAQTSPLSLDTSGLLRVSLKDTPANTNNLNVALAASSATVTVSASGNFNNASVSATGSAVPASASYIGANKSGNLTGLSLDGSGNLNVNVAAGSSGNAAAAATGSAVPANADYTGINVAGNLRGQTGVNPSGSIYAGQMDLASVAGTTADTNSGNKSAGTLRVVLATDQPSLTNALSVSQSGTWNINNVSGTVSLPTGAATAAKQPTLGTAGSASSDVLTVQGIASMTPLLTQDAADGPVSAGTAASKSILGGLVYNSSAPAPTSGQQLALQADQAGNMRVFPGIALVALSAWNSSTTVNSTQTIFSNSGADAVLVQLTQTTTLTGGAATFEVSYDGSTWGTIPANCVVDPTSTTFAQISLPYSFQASTNKQFLLLMNGAQGLRIKLSTGISGTGAVTPNYALLSSSPLEQVIAFSPTAANFNVSAVQSGAWTVTANAGTNLNTSALAVESGGNLATLAGGVSSSKYQVNVALINGAAPTMGNGVSGTGVQRVTIASDSTGQVTLAAGSAVIGHVIADSGSTTAVTQATASNLNAQVQGAAASGATQTGNPVKMGGVFNTTQPTVTTGQAVDAQMTARGAQIVATGVDAFAVNASQSGTWNITNISGTVSLPTGAAQDSSVNGLLVSQGSTTSGEKGPMVQAAVTTNAPSYTTAQTSPLSLDTSGLLRVSLKDTPANTNNLNVNLAASAATVTVAGSGNFTVTQSTGSNLHAVLDTGSNIIGKVGIDQTTIGTTNGITIVNNNTGSATSAEITATKRLRVQIDSTQIFYDAWDSGTVDTTYNWNAAVTGGNGSSTPSAGQEVLSSGTTASGYAYLTSKIKHQPVSPGYLQFDHQVQFTYPLPAHTYAYWGAGTVPATPTSSAPLTDAVAFELATNGKMSAVCYAGGTRNSIQDLSSATGNNTQPTDANVHKYEIYMRGDNIYWLIDSQTVTSISTGALGPNTNLLPIMLLSGVDATGASSAQQLTSAAVYVGDTSKAFFHISDPVHPQYAASVKPGSTAAAAADPSLIVGFSPNSPLPAGASTIGAVTQASGPWTVNTTQINSATISTVASGTQKVGVVGNTGAAFDSTVGAGTAPANAIAVSGLYNSAAPAPTSGQAMSLQLDQAGNMRLFPGIALATLSAWNSGTALNTTQTIFSNSGAEAVLVQLTQTTTLTAGAITFEVSYDGTNWGTIPANCVLDPTSTTFAQISLPYTVQASTNKQFLLNMNGAQGLRAKLSTQITGTGAVTPNYTLLPASPADTVIALSPTAANFNVSAVQSGTWAQNITQINSASIATAASGIMKVGVTDASGNSINSTSNALNVSVQNSTLAVTQSGTWTSVPNAATSGGSTASHTMSAASTNATSLKASAGMVYGLSISNANASARYFKLYNKASSPTVGTDTPILTLQIPGNGTVIRAYPVGLALGTGIAWAATGGIADSDTTTIGANDLSIDIDYK